MTNTDLLGIHHVTAMTDDVQRNYDFITDILGMRLVKKNSEPKTIFKLIIHFMRMIAEIQEQI